MTYYPPFQSEFETRLRRYREDCGAGKTHKLDQNQTREMVIDGDRRKFVWCWWCLTWTVSSNVEEDMLDTWSAEAKAFWRSKHPR